MDEELAALLALVPVPEDDALTVAVVETEAALVVEAEVALLAEALDEADVEEPARGAVDCPSISAWTEELNDPDMPSIVNLAEKERAGIAELFASLRSLESTRIKYSLLVAPIFADGMNCREETVATLTFSAMT